MRNQKINWDRLGMASSGLCVIHCALIPILVVFGSFEAAHWLHHPVLEIGFFGLAITFFVGSIRKKMSPNQLPPWYFFLGILGFAGLVFGHYLPAKQGVILSIFGGVLIIVTHYFNLKSNYSCYFEPK